MTKSPVSSCNAAMPNTISDEPVSADVSADSIGDKVGMAQGGSTQLGTTRGLQRFLFLYFLEWNLMNDFRIVATVISSRALVL